MGAVFRSYSHGGKAVSFKALRKNTASRNAFVDTFAYMYRLGDIFIYRCIRGHYTNRNVVRYRSQDVCLENRFVSGFAFGSFACTLYPKKFISKLSKKHGFVSVIISIAAIGVLFICTAYLADSTFSPFLYYIF